MEQSHGLNVGTTGKKTILEDRVRGRRIEGQSLVLCRDPGGDQGIGCGVLNQGLYWHERRGGILKEEIKDLKGFARGWGWRGCLGKLSKWVALFWLTCSGMEYNSELMQHSPWHHSSISLIQSSSAILPIQFHSIFHQHIQMLDVFSFYIYLTLVWTVFQICVCIYIYHTFVIFLVDIDISSEAY